MLVRQAPEDTAFLGPSRHVLPEGANDRLMRYSLSMASEFAKYGLRARFRSHAPHGGWRGPAAAFLPSSY